MRFTPPGADIREALMLLGPLGKADGVLQARLCQDETCVQASADLSTLSRDHYVPLRFSPALSTHGAKEASLTVYRNGGQNPIRLWGRPNIPPESGNRPVLVLVPDSAPIPVFESEMASVFELLGAEKYASAPACRIEASSRDQFETNCDQDLA